MRRTICTAATILSLLATSSNLHAQTVIRGTVRADSTLTVIHGAFVMLIGVDGSAIASAVSGSDGQFVLDAEPGRFQLHVRRVGYSPTVTPEFEVPAAGTDVELTVLLPQDALVLDTVAVEGEAEPFAPGPLRGFYERMRRGFGSFLTRKEIEEKNPYRLTDAMRLMRSVQIVKMPRDKDRPFGPRSRNYTIRIRGMRYARGIAGGECVPVLYLDGAKLGPVDDAEYGGLDVFVFPSDVEGIEVYRPSEAPGEFAGSEAGCGVIVIWTRRSP